jgi:hypothetical protein
MLTIPANNICQYKPRKKDGGVVGVTKVQMKRLNNQAAMRFCLIIQPQKRILRNQNRMPPVRLVATRNKISMKSCNGEQQSTN